MFFYTKFKASCVRNLGEGRGGVVVEGGELKGESGIKIDLNCFSVLVNPVPLYGNDKELLKQHVSKWLDEMTKNFLNSTFPNGSMYSVLH